MQDGAAPILYQADGTSVIIGNHRAFDGAQTLNTGRSTEIQRGKSHTLIQNYGSNQRAQIFTIHCGYVDKLPFDGDDPILNQTTLISLVGKLKWGTGAGSQSAEFDFVRGTFVCVEGSFIQLDVEYEELGQAFESPPLIVSASWGYETKGTTGTVGHLVRTHHFFANPIVGGASTGWRRIPPYAVSATVDTSTGLGFSFDTSATPGGQVQFVSFAAQSPINSLVQYYRITNTSANPITAAARFLLAI